MAELAGAKFCLGRSMPIKVLPPVETHRRCVSRRKRTLASVSAVVLTGMTKASPRPCCHGVVWSGISGFCMVWMCKALNGPFLANAQHGEASHVAQTLHRDGDSNTLNWSLSYYTAAFAKSVRLSHSVQQQLPIRTAWTGPMESRIAIFAKGLRTEVFEK